MVPDMHASRKGLDIAALGLILREVHERRPNRAEHGVISFEW
jgi:hypothetical protein